MKLENKLKKGAAPHKQGRRLLTFFVAMLTLFTATSDIHTSINVQTSTSTTYNKFLFVDQSHFYSGAASTGNGTESLTRAYLSTQDGSTVVSSKNIAPETATVNGTQGDNPIYNADITNIASMSGYPVLTLGTKNAASTISPAGDNQTVCYIGNKDDAKTIAVNTALIADAAETQVGVEIQGLACSRKTMFVPVATGGMSDADAGIAVCKLISGTIATFDATTGVVGNKAKDLSEAGSNHTIENHITMHWDNTLKRLFIGLHTSNATDPSSGLLVGRILSDEKPQLILEPALPHSLLSDSDTNYIVAYQDTTGNYEVQIHLIRTLHTSTGKSYVIINGNVYDTNSGTILKTECFALPIVHKTFSDKTLDVPDDAGKITDNDNINQNAVLSAIGKATTKDDVAANVGQDATPGDVLDMYTLGDAVYVVCDEVAGVSPAGTFVSHAIFDKDGLVRNWTAWQRITTNAAPYISRDTGSGNFWYTDQTTNPGDTVHVTQWKGEDEDLRGNLQTALQDQLPTSAGGASQTFLFDEATPSFLSDEFSMAVATGNSEVSLIQTGETSASGFIPTSGTDFSTNLADYVKNFNGANFPLSGPVVAAEISRSANADEGWLFVGGYDGLAVLRQSSGAGWTDLSNVVADLSGFTFKKIGNFSRVIKIVCDGTYAYVLTPKNLYRIEMTAAQFADGAPTLTSEVIATANQSNQTDARIVGEYDSFLDFVVSTKIGLLGTTAGLFRTQSGENIAGTASSAQLWTQVKTAAGYTLGPVGHLYTIGSIRGTFAYGGNVYALATNMSTGLSTIVRFDLEDTTAAPISDTSIQPIAEHKKNTTDNTRDYFVPFGSFRGGISTDGSFIYTNLPAHFDVTDLAKKAPMVQTLSGVRNFIRAIPLSLKSGTRNIGIMGAHSAAGSWTITTDDQVKFHE